MADQFSRKAARSFVDRLPGGWLSLYLLCQTLLVVSLSGCEGGCARSDAPSHSHSVAFAEHIPHNARAVLFAAKFENLLEAARSAEKYLPDEANFGALRERATALLENDFMAAENWRAMGLATDEPATVFYAENRLVLAASVHQPAAFKTQMAALGARSNLSIEREKARGFSLFHVTNPAKEPLAHVALGDKTALFLFDPSLFRTDARQDVSEDERARGREMLRELLRIEPAKRWKGIARQNELLQEVSGAAAFHGAVEPAAWLLKKQTGGQARVLLERLAHQTGRVHFLANYNEETHRLAIHLRTHGNPGEPVMVAGLGEPHGELPTVRGLIKPGVLGVVRLSGEPDQFYNLIRSGLPAEQRLALDKLFTELDAELKIDVKNDLIKNLTGHAIIVMYGIENRVLTAENFRMADIFQLKATREAVLLPLQDREAMERLLNVMTQLSRGNLRRQAIRDSIQYAWLSDGALEWALILNNDYLVVVDSAAAVDHALAYERSAPVHGTMLSELGIEALFEKTSRSGFYVDVVALSNIFAESGYPMVSAWLRPFQAIVLTTEDVELVGHTNIELTLSSDEMPTASTP